MKSLWNRWFGKKKAEEVSAEMSAPAAITQKDQTTVTMSPDSYIENRLIDHTFKSGDSTWKQSTVNIEMEGDGTEKLSKTMNDLLNNTYGLMGSGSGYVRKSISDIEAQTQMIKRHQAQNAQNLEQLQRMNQLEAGKLEAGVVQADVFTNNPSIAIIVKDTTGKETIRVRYDGDVIFGEGITPDEAAQSFWAGIRTWSPYSPNRCKHCGERRAEHGVNGKCYFDTSSWEEDEENTTPAGSKIPPRWHGGSISKK